MLFLFITTCHNRIIICSFLFINTCYKIYGFIIIIIIYFTYIGTNEEITRYDLLITYSHST